VGRGGGLGRKLALQIESLMKHVLESSPSIGREEGDGMGDRGGRKGREEEGFEWGEHLVANRNRYLGPVPTYNIEQIHNNNIH
jgi:hypothetical protein